MSQRLSFHVRRESLFSLVDSEDIELAAGDIVRIAPDGKRQFFVAADSEISYACIQVRAGSLEAYTADDAVIE